MAARPRIRKRAHFPPNLHEPRPGYYTWRNPLDGKTHVIGRVPLAQAIQEANEANAHAERALPRRSLIDRVAFGQETIRDLLAQMPDQDTAVTTQRKRRSMDKTICEHIGDIECSALEVRHIAEMLEAISNGGKPGWAKDIRNRMISACAKALAKGWMKTNPAALTERPKVKVRRQRLTLDAFQAIRAKAPEVNLWLENAMLLALISGQDRATVTSWKRAQVSGDTATVSRAKTKHRLVLAIPTALRLDVIGLSLADVIQRCKSTGVVSQHLIHHVVPQGAARRGDPVSPDTVSAAFTEARRLAGIPDEGAPTFHEIRSLSKRLYDQQGNVDTKTLLGHTTDSMAELYANSRGAEPVRVRYNAS